MSNCPVRVEVNRRRMSEGRTTGHPKREDFVPEARREIASGTEEWNILEEQGITIKLPDWGYDHGNRIHLQERLKNRSSRRSHNSNKIPVSFPFEELMMPLSTPFFFLSPPPKRWQIPQLQRSLFLMEIVNLWCCCLSVSK